MYTYNHAIRVRYAETDQMGYVYYGNYSTYYEVARTEALRNLGVTYKEVEDAGVIMPVLRNNSLYLKPARYDDLINIRVIVKERPEARMIFFYEFYVEKELIHKGDTTLVFVNKATLKPCKTPDLMAKVLNPFFDEAKN